MIELYESRAEQDRAVEQLLRSIRGATKRYSVEFMETINGSDHEAYAAVVLGYVDVWMTDDWFYVRVNQTGVDWLKARQKGRKRPSWLIQMLLHITKFRYKCIA